MARRQTRLLLVCCIASLWLAGCGAPEDDPDEEVPQTGVLDGRVVDDTRLGIPGAKVTVLLVGIQARTGADGAFHFAAVPAGTIRVAASAEGYTTATRTIAMPAGGRVVIEVVLLNAPTVEAYHNTRDFSGKVQCGVTAGVDCGQQLGSEATTHWFEVDPDLAGLVIEVEWSPPTTGFAERLAVDVLAATSTACGSRYNGEQGASPLTLRVTDGFPISGGHQCARVRPAEDASAVDQEYTLYATAFYHEPPPSDFTARV